jgi:hypothetical protein
VTRVGLIAAVIIIIVASVFFGFRKAAKNAAQDKAAAGSARHPSKGTPLEETRSFRKIDPASRKLLLAHIEEARAKRASAGGGGGGGGGSSPVPALPALPADYIRTQVKAIVPLMIECYETALADDPKLAGKLVMKFSLGGEPDVGGLVETSEVDAETSTITDPGMIECMRETMYALEFAAPAEGGRVEVTYPFEFSSLSN